MNGPAEIPFCPEPFTFLNRDDDRFFTCCPGWMDESRFIWDASRVPAPTLSTISPNANLWEVWNHPALVELRKALLRRDYRYCQRCPNRFRPRDRTVPLPDETPVMSRPPVTYQCLDDHACNLRCPSCRNDFQVSRPKVWPLSRVVRDMPGIQTVALSLSGDPFASQDCRQFLATDGTPDVILWTNGLLLPRYWDEIRRKVTVVVMSIDAAQEATYEALRWPGRWKDLLASLAFLRDLVRSGTILFFQTVFVVQASNWRQMVDFVHLCREHAVTLTQFTLIAPWPHITSQRWREVNVCDSRHPDHAGFLSLLSHPTLRESDVDMGLVSESSIAFYGQHEAGTNFWHGHGA